MLYNILCTFFFIYLLRCFTTRSVVNRPFRRRRLNRFRLSAATTTARFLSIHVLCIRAYIIYYVQDIITLRYIIYARRRLYTYARLRKANDNRIQVASDFLQYILYIIRARQIILSSFRPCLRLLPYYSYC